MCKMDSAVNLTHPVYVIPWKAAGPGSPEYTFLVATVGDEIVGYLLYQKPPGEEEPGEWDPKFPDGTNLKFFEKVFREIKAAKKQYNLKDCWGTYLS
jgi:hypothetical protein